MTTDDPESGHRVTVVGVMTLAFGAFNIFRLFPEFLVLHQRSDGYSILIWCEFAIGLFGVISGIALIMLRGRWSCNGAAVFWGALSTSAGLLYLAPSGDFGIDPGRGDVEGVYTPRIWFYVLIGVSLPYSLWALITRVKQLQTTVVSLLVFLLLGTGVGGFFTGRALSGH